ncbi:MAG TPA: hypothetical protein VHB27_18185 [Rhodopila sp.]|uniref:hypothetical protein n=1 Tax=Rhodopila sp. TaxID=2480087 RepID=UPI002D0F477E|nr:hypothetical protein [Rhodopila sp.]HVY17158.1 hypothetical protein [Rhodopila sp.]
MAVSSSVVDRDVVQPASGAESSVSAVSWAAVLAGTAVTLAIAFVLTALAFGLGLTGVSAWPQVGATARTFTIATGIGLIVVQWLSCAFGGFVTGRLRTKWAGLHTHEVFFRDTAHGLLTWAMATLIGAALLSAAMFSVAGGAARGTASVAEEGVHAAANGVSHYTIGTLFRSDQAASISTQDAIAQASTILANGLRTGDVPQGDRTYLAQLVAAKTGMGQQDAQKRVDDAIEAAKTAQTKAREAAEAARKATATFTIFIALSLVIGAFVASAAAAYGGNVRDEY